jgi:hypothetical protein
MEERSWQRGMKLCLNMGEQSGTFAGHSILVVIPVAINVCPYYYRSQLA